MRLLGIDQGTTGTRACLVDAETLSIVRQSYAAHTRHQPQPGWIEHDPMEIWACTQRVIADVLKGERPIGVAIANQGETCLVWDLRLSPSRAIVWQDTRTADTVAALSAHEARVRERTGLRLDPYFSAPKLRWLLEHGLPEHHNAHYAGTLDTWLIGKLGGDFATDASTAARTLLCDIDRGEWSDELCALFGVSRYLLPEIRDTDGGFGTCKGLGLDGVPIIASIVDQPAALAGQGCIDRGDAKATFGTGCFLYVNTGTQRPAAGKLLATIAWRRATADRATADGAAADGAAADGAARAATDGAAADRAAAARAVAADGRRDVRGTTTYALDGGVLAVGSAFSWLRELGLLAGDDLAWQPTDVVCVPALVGLGAPHWNRDVRAAWLNMSSATTRADLVSAVIDGICCRVAEVVDATERAAGIRIDVLRADGGLTRSRALMQRQADLLGRPIAVAEEDEATVVGACALAALKLGTLSESDLRARKTRSSATYEPRISDDERGAMRARFARALDQIDVQRADLVER